MLNDDVWKNVNRSRAFEDLIHGTPAQFDTRAAVTWDDQYLWIPMCLNVSPTLYSTAIDRATGVTVSKRCVPEARDTAGKRKEEDYCLPLLLCACLASPLLLLERGGFA